MGDRLSVKVSIAVILGVLVGCELSKQFRCHLYVSSTTGVVAEVLMVAERPRLVAPIPDFCGNSFLAEGYGGVDVY